MEFIWAIVIGALYAAGLYMIMRRSIFKIVLGLALLGYAANLLIFIVSNLTRGNPPLVPPGATAPIAPYADPLPQALILTAIVIGFGITAFLLALGYRMHALEEDEG